MSAGFWVEEGDVCPNCIGGTMQIPEVEGCSCHITAPCGACVSNPLTCDTCGHTEDKE